ncbi:MAG: FtsW/RodA/SpoVE family cell cycle protein, partial [Candidatus Omnitrophica bacterium]|nr:FtsW/RodA/SpoVE family cell cycle protein [Candidatus Omnitrophota bacterium]
MASRSLIKQFDWVLFGAAMLLTVIGLSAVYSATLQIEMDHFQKQLIWTAVGLGIFLITVGIGYRRFLDFSYLFYLITVLALAGVLVWGDVRYGARRWLDLGFVALQPSEFVKPVLIIVLARFVGANRFSMGRWAGLLRPLFLVALPFFLVLLEPDLGTAL